MSIQYTPNYALPWPQSGDPVREGATAIEGIAKRVEQVMTDANFPVGNPDVNAILIELAKKPKGVIAQQKATAGSGAISSGTMAVVNNITNVPLVSGRRYRIAWTTDFYTSTTTCTPQFRIHKAANTDAAALITGLTTLADTEYRPTTANERYPLNLVTYFDATVTENAQFKVTLSIVSGSGSVIASAAPTFPAYITIEDVGSSTP